LFGVPELSEEAIRDFVRQHRLPAVAMPEQRVNAASSDPCAERERWSTSTRSTTPTWSSGC
jgi:hypothetical protein